MWNIGHFEYNEVVIFVPDVRFDNEASLIQELGGVIVKINRDSEQGDGHASEAGISGRLVDYVIDNNGTLEDLEQQAKELWEELEIWECAR
jgi:hypothetical protein